MPAIPRLRVDLTAPPARRWLGLRPFREAARRLILAYADLPRSPETEAALDEIERCYVDPEHVAELDAVAHLVKCDRALVRHANYHYDGMKLLNGPPAFACTAIATQTPTGPIHARNLDWFTEGGILATSTIIVDFHGAPAGAFTLVTWPGFVGALSAVAPGRFAVTLNFVTSGEPFQPGAPLVFVLREILERASTFDAARDALLEKPLLSDALILLTGIRPDERLVIERTPSRAVTRIPDGAAPLVVTNDYRALNQRGSRGQLGQTSCARYDRALELAPDISTLDGAIEALEDEQIRMGITAQHMAMQASTGTLHVELPERFRNTSPPPREGFWKRLFQRRR
jgi:hypothetical protein